MAVHGNPRTKVIISLVVTNPRGCGFISSRSLNNQLVAKLTATLFISSLLLLGKEKRKSVKNYYSENQRDLNSIQIANINDSEIFY